jgi:hypothetical protein
LRIFVLFFFQTSNFVLKMASRKKLLSQMRIFAQKIFYDEKYYQKTTCIFCFCSLHDFVHFCE